MSIRVFDVTVITAESAETKAGQRGPAALKSAFDAFKAAGLPQPSIGEVYGPMNAAGAWSYSSDVLTVDISGRVATIADLI